MLEKLKDIQSNNKRNIKTRCTVHTDMAGKRQQFFYVLVQKLNFQRPGEMIPPIM
jgi:hypothetical protein